MLRGLLPGGRKAQNLIICFKQKTRIFTVKRIIIIRAVNTSALVMATVTLSETEE